MLRKQLILALALTGLDAQAAEIGRGSVDPDFGDQALRLGVAFAIHPSEYANDNLFAEDAVIAPNSDLLLLSSAYNATAGASSFVHRFDASGAPVMSFAGSTGFITVPGTTPFMNDGLEVAADGSIWISLGAGGTHIVEKYAANGASDAAFATNGRLTMEPDTDKYLIPTSTAFHDGKLYVSRSVRFIDATSGSYVWHPEIVRMDGNGIDGTFGDGGKVYVATDFRGRHLRVDSNGKLYYRGHFADNTWAILRLTADGEPDNDFGDDGWVSMDELLQSVPGWQALNEEIVQTKIHDIDIDTNDDVMITGSVCCVDETEQRLFVVRLNGVTGNIDTNYGNGSGWSVDPYSTRPSSYFLSSITPTGLVSLGFDPDVADTGYRRYLLDSGAPDTHFSENGVHFDDTGISNEVIIDSAGGLVAATNYRLEGELNAGLQRHLGIGETATVDTVPDAFFIDDVNGKYINSTHTGELSVTDVDTATPVTMTAICRTRPDADPVTCHYSTGFRINGGDFNANGSTAQLPLGGTVTMSVAAIGKPGGIVEVTLGVGGVTDSFNVRTRDDEPEAFAIPTVSNATPGAFVTSEVIVIEGIDVPITLSILDDGPGEFSVNGDAFSREAREVENNDSVEFGLSASTTPGETRSASFAWMTAGEIRSVQFHVTAGESSEEPTGEPADEPADEPVDEPADEPVDEPADEPVDEPEPASEEEEGGGPLSPWMLAMLALCRRRQGGQR